jgi:hypothetical protein
MMTMLDTEFLNKKLSEYESSNEEFDFGCLPKYMEMSAAEVKELSSFLIELLKTAKGKSDSQTCAETDDYAFEMKADISKYTDGDYLKLLSMTKALDHNDSNWKNDCDAIIEILVNDNFLGARRGLDAVRRGIENNHDFHYGVGVVANVYDNNDCTNNRKKYLLSNLCETMDNICKAVLPFNFLWPGHWLFTFFVDEKWKGSKTIEDDHILYLKYKKKICKDKGLNMKFDLKHDSHGRF